jgi:hypothetical protein
MSVYNLYVTDRGETDLLFSTDNADTFNAAYESASNYLDDKKRAGICTANAHIHHIQVPPVLIRDVDYLMQRRLDQMFGEVSV